ncbi:hypothetical protein FOXYSP1_01746 [Fusarium oxysporum f. sp. phaseoli]
MMASTESISPFFKDPDSLGFNHYLKSIHFACRLGNSRSSSDFCPIVRVVTNTCTGGLMYTNTISASLSSQSVSCACARLTSYACHLYKHVPFRRGDALVRCGEGQFFLGFPCSSKLKRRHGMEMSIGRLITN